VKDTSELDFTYERPETLEPREVKMFALPYTVLGREVMLDVNFESLNVDDFELSRKSAWLCFNVCLCS
jgi:hypothetical protein